MKYFVLLCSFFIFSHNQFCSMQKRPTVMKSTVLEQLIGMARSVDPHPDTIECKDIFKILHNGICKKDSQYQRYIVIAQDGVLFNKEQACITYVEDTAIEVSMTNVLDFQFNTVFEDACNPGGGYYYLGSMICKYGIYQFYQNIFSFDCNRTFQNRIVAILLHVPKLSFSIDKDNR